MRFRLLLLPPAVLACASVTGRQTAHSAPPLTASAADSGKPKPEADSAKIKPYKQVIPATATTRRGMFITHLVDDKLYFEIPASELDKDMLLSGSLARAPEGGESNGGEAFGTDRVLRWQRDKNRIILRSPSYRLMADSTLSVYRAVAASSYAPVIAILPVEAYGPDSAAVIDVTRLYTTDVVEFSAFPGRLDEKRSYIEHVTAFPDNVEVEATQTGAPPNRGSGDGDGPRPAQSIVAHWSMVRLPAQPMQPRRADERVGYFSISRLDFGNPEQHVSDLQYIARWRLEKKDPSAAVSDPVKPMIYYIDPATPDKWKPWVKRGIEAWQPAFEAAGFRHAIIAMDPPANDPDWSMDDIRHTAVRWLASTVENAYGPCITDPRTGEILNGTVRIFHNVLNLVRDWYFTQVGPLDPRTRHLPLPDSLMGQLIQYVVTHEVGHTLGLPHDQLGSSTYPADSVRSRTWTHRMGHSPSIMDYSRFNYVAQPEDSIALEDLIPRVGPYDVFAVKWGYTPITGAHTPEDERMTLDAWALAQDTVPWYRFSEQNEAGEYGTLREAVGDADPVKSTGYGIRNIRRVLGFLLEVTLQPGKDNSDLQELYGRTLDQWKREMRHVVTVVGGATVQYKSGSQPGPVYVPLPVSRQRAAVRFLDTAAFRTPKYFADVTITRRFEPAGTIAQITGAQAALLASLLDNDRMNRLSEYEAAATDRRSVYPLAEMLADVRGAVWAELSHGSVSTDVYRQALQEAYLDDLNEKLNPKGDNKVTAQQRALLRGELLALRSAVNTAIPRGADRTTRLHLQTVSHEIGKILDPKP